LPVERPAPRQNQRGRRSARRPGRSSPGRSPTPRSRRRRRGRRIARSPAWPSSRRSRPATTRRPRPTPPRRRSRPLPCGSRESASMTRKGHNAQNRDSPARPRRSVHHIENRTLPHRQCESRSADTPPDLPPQRRMRSHASSLVTHRAFSAVGVTASGVHTAPGALSRPGSYPVAVNEHIGDVRGACVFL
jgi:hypothetical protein